MLETHNYNYIVKSKKIFSGKFLEVTQPSVCVRVCVIKNKS